MSETMQSTAVSRLRALAERLERLDLFRQSQLRAYDKQFETNTTANMFRGVFDSFAAAAASAPKSRPIGYDNPASASLYRRWMAVDPHDYPAMFWLMRSLDEGMRSIFDWGGSIGMKYHAFAKHIPYPDSLVWTVCDVSAAVEQGRDLARQRQCEHRLHFTTEPTEMSTADVLYASGVLQYLPMTLAEMLGQLATKPRRLVINTTAIHPDRSYFTLNSIGTAFCPYRVQAIDPFCREVEATGYRLKDQWANIGKALELPMDPGFSLSRYMGFCFERDPVAIQHQV